MLAGVGARYGENRIGYEKDDFLIFKAEDGAYSCQSKVG